MSEFESEHQDGGFKLRPELAEAYKYISVEEIEKTLALLYQNRDTQTSEEMLPEEFSNGIVLLRTMLLRLLRYDYHDKQLILPKEEFEEYEQELLEALHKAEKGDLRLLFQVFTIDLVDAVMDMAAENLNTDFLKKIAEDDMVLDLNTELKVEATGFAETAEELFESIEKGLPIETILSNFDNYTEAILIKVVRLQMSLNTYNAMVRGVELSVHERDHIERTLFRISNLVKAVRFLRKIIYPDKIW